MTSCDSEGRCITCGDVAVPMSVVRLEPGSGLALCADADGASSEVQVELVAPLEPGDLVLVHAGVALTRLAEAPA
jgi:hydrogenase expression/formation protein HypC